jgi:hypothetical protein
MAQPSTIVHAKQPGVYIRRQVRIVATPKSSLFMDRGLQLTRGTVLALHESQEGRKSPLHEAQDFDR